MKKITMILSLSISLFLVACGGGSGWSSDERSAYLDGCNSGGYVAMSYCECTLDYLEDAYPDPNDMMMGDADAVLQAAEDCAHHLY